jgi:hypothetical protein
MPANKGNKGGDSKQGLIITLVCFVLLCIILGVTTYMGYSGWGDEKGATAKAKQEETAAKKGRDEWQFRALAVKSFAGLLTDKKEQSDLDALRGQYENSEDYKTLETALAKDGLALDKNTKKPLKTYSEEKKRLETDLANTQAKLNKADDDLKKAQADYHAMEEAKDAEVKQFKGNYEKAQKDNLALEDKMNKMRDSLIVEFGELNRQLTDLKKKTEEQLGEKDKEKGKLVTMIKDLQGKTDKLQRQITPPDLTKFENPKGRIVRMDPRAEMAYVDIGSADNVRPQQNLTFSVFSSESGKPHIRKGSVEIVNVVDSHLSMAKVTEMLDPGRYPIMPGDLLVNPSWSPDARGHVAIAGLIDLLHDGRDNIEEFMKNLKQQGVEIDAYLDWHDLQIKGPGMSIKTEYLILGNVPEYDSRQPLKLDDPRIQRKNDINDKIGELQNQATRLGVTIVPLRRYVALTGYKMPRGVGGTQGFGFEKPGITASEAKEPSTRKEKPAAPKSSKKEEKEDKEDKKDDSDK